MFRGRSKHTLDEKGRLAIPARFRDALSAKGVCSIVLTNHFSCLWGFSVEDWKGIEEKASGLSLFDDSVNTFRRYFISGAQECLIKQGRITIPPDLREIAELKKDVVLVGELKYFEIWEKEKWEVEFERVKKGFPEAGKALSGMGI
jgi:MraZ protein